MTFKKVREQLISINRLSLVSGISRNQIYNIESGKCVPRLDTAFLLWFILDDICPYHLDFMKLWSDYQSLENLDCKAFSMLQVFAEPQAFKKEK